MTRLALLVLFAATLCGCSTLKGVACTVSMGTIGCTAPLPTQVQVATPIPTPSPLSVSERSSYVLTANR